MLDPQQAHCQAVVLATTREMCHQIVREAAQIGQFLKLSVQLVISGVAIPNCSANALIVGTPGRVWDAIQLEKLSVEHVKWFVLDNVDEMIERGVGAHIFDVFQHLSPSVQVLINTHTMPEEVLFLERRLMRSPVRVLVADQHHNPLIHIKQFYVAAEKKLETLCDLLNGTFVPPCIIFCNTRRKVTWLAQQLAEHGFVVSSLHGDQMAEERERNLATFLEKASRTLVTTNLSLCKGIHLDPVSLVINFDFPTEHGDYIHRVGRCFNPSSSRPGVLINLLTSDDTRALRETEVTFAISIDELPADWESNFA
jgi:superfamily II DNA/RNA helicase